MSEPADRHRALVSIWFPNFMIDRWTRNCAQQGDAHASDAPVVLVTDTAHGPRIDAANAAAMEAGALAGMRLADARTIHAGLIAVPADRMGDEAALERMAFDAQRWGPWSAPDRPHGIMLDVTGALHFYEHPGAMLMEIEQRYAARGYLARAAMAPTVLAAWALSHSGPRRAIVTDGEDPFRSLARLPVAALRLEDDVLQLLGRLGLKTIGALAAVPRDSLARRFRNRRSADANPLMRLDQLAGLLPDPLVPLVENPPAQADRRLLEPLLHTAPLRLVIADLAEDLCHTLEARREGVRRLQLLLWRVDGTVFERRIELAAPSREPAHVTRLFDERLDNTDAGFGIDQARLIAIWTEPLAAVQAALGRGEDRGSNLPQLIDRLTTRLGQAAVRRPAARASHVPERAQSWRGATPDAPVMQYDLAFHRRPLKLLDRAEPITVIYATPEGLPRRFRWRGSLHDIARVEGPERIAPEWWRERSGARLRDYYRIEDRDGRRYWIYRHGVIGDGRGGIPDWYLHGLFA